MRWLRVISLFAVLLTVSCLRDPEVDRNEPDAPTVSCDESSKTRVSFTVSGHVNKIIPNATYGLIIEAEDGDRQEKTYKEQDLSSDNTFQWKVEGLNPGSPYLIKSYVSNDYGGRKYSESILVSTPKTSIATLSSVTFDKISGLLRATIIDDGGRGLEDYGFLYGPSPDPKELRREKRYSGVLNGIEISLPIGDLNVDQSSNFIAYVEDKEGHLAYSPSCLQLTLIDIYCLEIVPDNGDTSVKIGSSIKMIPVVIPSVELSFDWSSDNEQVATVSNEGVVSGVSEGTCIIKASCGELEAAYTIVVEPIPVASISLDPATVSLIEGQSTQLIATVLPENATNQTVTWSSSNTSVASVSQEGLVSAISPGSASITASAGDITATCLVTISAAVIPVTSVSLDYTDLSLEEGQTATLVATVLPEDATDKSVTWTSSNSSVASVSQAGLVTAAASGSSTITAKAGDKTATCQVTVTPAVIPVTSVSLDQQSLSFEVGETATLVATVLPEDATDKSVTWTSSNTSVASVSQDGVVSAIAIGTCTVYASCGGKQTYCQIAVISNDEIPVALVSFDETEREVYVGEIFTLSPTIIPSNATNPQLEWRSSNTSVAIVDSKGSITPVGEGECTIEANALSGVFCSFTCKVVSEAPVFADEGFRNYIYLNFDTDGNGFLSRREVLQVRRIHYEGKECKTMAGIEWLESLESLWCYSNELTSLDVSHNVALQYLSCGNNQLTSLDVSQNITLNILYCGSNQLTSLDVSHNVALQHLRCGNNQLTGLDVMNNMALQSLSCDNNQLTSLDVSRNPELDFLSCVNMQLTSLDVSNNMAIEYLQCGGNQLTSLDVSRHPKLLTLSCGSNQLTSLDVSNNMALKDLYCDGNQLTSLEVSNNMALHTLWCRFNQLTSLDVSNNMALKTLWCRGNQLTSLDVSRNSELKELDCLSNHLTSLDVSNNMALQSLSCDYNQLTSLDVSNNMALEDLYCESNQLTSLDLRHNESLSSLNCRDNPLIDIWLNNAQSFTTFEYPPSATLHYE